MNEFTFSSTAVRLGKLNICLSWIFLHLNLIQNAHINQIFQSYSFKMKDRKINHHPLKSIHFALLCFSCNFFFKPFRFFGSRTLNKLAGWLFYRFCIRIILEASQQESYSYFLFNEIEILSFN
jgi:hypothetical protein